MYIRFVVGGEAENAYWLSGVFSISRILRDQGELFACEARRLNVAYLRGFGSNASLSSVRGAPARWRVVRRRGLLVS